MYCIVSSKYCILLKGASCWQKTMDLLRIGFLVKLAFFFFVGQGQLSISHPMALLFLSALLMATSKDSLF